mmetsp:Transcript_11267/g.8274  ORF Transcript_11267/g.8274 Transcript_11267/m.8274 type:complete len:154 (+) Transcript_11267:2092-2553(+)|eukprot:CAMPEP_0202966670 /NCGR_PEP_ID=MMETSP1396-20130829/11209_1 /ASSEMBLY_ACC=CAM_ASM_000872 /TAXON_ID= /ORGANISM="Pseudokeronopsis sp., Strain Brazil" /LENGTH=153 /DNA_ID=CAMNT_0049690835 /DNA_START=2088 /DNA_END=2549 /DNA_ORIENTATION=+
MAGLAFVKGMYNRHMGDPLGALKELNIARFDSVFGEQAITNMIDIYFNPLNEMIYTASGDQEYTSTADNLKAAGDLIGELAQRGVDTAMFDIAKLIHAKTKNGLESCAKRLQDLLAKNKNYVPALYYMALSKFLLKKSTDARNYLKTLLSNEY